MKRLIAAAVLVLALAVAGAACDSNAYCYNEGPGSPTYCTSQGSGG